MTTIETQPKISFGTRIHVSPFFNATRRWGYKSYTTYNHMFMPAFFESPEADFWKLVNDVTLWDVAGERQVEITGPDAARFVQYLTPRDLSACKIGQCKYLLLTDNEGGILNDPILLKLGDDHFWLSLADADILFWARGVAIHAGMDVKIGEPDVSPLQIQGPKATDVMVALLGAGIADLAYFRFIQTTLAGAPVIVSRTGWSGERGYEVFLRDSNYGDAVWETIMEAGEPFEIAPAAPNTIRRIEAGILSYGADMTIKNNPFEINLERLLDLDQDADFIGKTSLKQIAAEGVRRRLVGLKLSGSPIISPNIRRWPIIRDGETVGDVTSAIYSPRMEANLALAILSVDAAELGQELMVETVDGPVTGTVSPLPFHQKMQTAQA